MMVETTFISLADTLYCLTWAPEAIRNSDAAVRQPMYNSLTVGMGFIAARMIPVIE